MQIRRLINELPGTRQNMDCIACASTCPGSEQCAADPVCADSLGCVANRCGVRNMNPGAACLIGCLGANPQAFNEAVAAVACVYGTCAQACTGRMR
jgi:hypothetical protein